MSPIAAVSKVSSVTLQGSGPAASTVYIVQDTSVQVKSIAAPVIGLAQTLPITAELGTSVIAAFDNITKLPADKRLTGSRVDEVMLLTFATVEPVLPASSI